MVLLVVVVALLALMVTGYNTSVPGLHPASSAPVVVVGERTVASFLFVTNGTILTATDGVLCPECPFDVAPASSFTYSLTMINSFNRSLEIRQLSASLPFHLDSMAPALPQQVAPGLSVSLELTLTAPSAGGATVIPLTLVGDVG